MYVFFPALKSTAACVLINDPPQQKDLGDFDKKKKQDEKIPVAALVWY